MTNIKNHFGALPNQFSDYDRSHTIIIPVPYEKSTTYITGTNKGPMAILNASKQLELYDYNTGKNYAEQGIAVVSPIKAGTAEQVIKKTSKTVLKVLNHGKLPVMLGGEHTIAIGAAYAGHDVYDDLTVLCFDAHLDLRDSFYGKYNHACTLRRIRDKIKNTVHVGFRTCCDQEIKYAKQNKIPVFHANMLNTDNLVNRNTDKIIKKLGKHVYITFDLDVFDPCIMPAVGNPCPGGLGWYNTLKLLKKISEKSHIIGFDIVELCPISGLEYPNFTAAQLLYTLIGYCLTGSQNINRHTKC